MANVEIKDGEYTNTIYSLIKEQRWVSFGDYMAFWKIISLILLLMPKSGPITIRLDVSDHA